MSPLRLTKHGQRLDSGTHPVQAVCMDMRPHSGKPLHKAFNLVPGGLIAGRVSQAEVAHGPDEVTRVSSLGIDQPGMTASYY